MESQTNEFSYFFEKGENAPGSLFYERKRGSGRAKRHHKTIKNRCKIDAGKRHGKIMQNDAKKEPKWEPKSIPNLKKAEKRHAENDAEI